MTWAFKSILFPENLNWFHSERMSRKSLLYFMQERKCEKCKNEFLKEELTVDHIKPKCEGGSNTLDNLQLLCEPCHRKKTILEHVMKVYARLIN